MDNRETIAAKASGSGGAISLIRLSGAHAIAICDSIFEFATKGNSSSDVVANGESAGQCDVAPNKVHKKLATQKGFTLHYGLIKSNGKIVDDVLLSLFRAPHSYTGEDMVEISCHASPYIEQEILRLCAESGARTAQRGEFTLRAFMNGKMELSQAEAVADIIAADSRASHALASKQMRGGYSHEFTELRDKLLELLSLLELELDFSEEDVEFADRKRILDIVISIEFKIAKLASSFKLGNILKNGVPVAIVGSPNVGKSTLLNALLNEEKAMVSDIAGTTRDTVEDTINLGGVCFRFIDTAGIRDTSDRLENMGIERTLRKIETASVVLIVVDAASFGVDNLDDVNKIISLQDPCQSVCYAIVVNKIDKLTDANSGQLVNMLKAHFSLPVFSISAREHLNVELLIDFLINSIGESISESDRNSANNFNSVNSTISNGLLNDSNTPIQTLCKTTNPNSSILNSEDIIVFNSRHHEALLSAQSSLLRVRESLSVALPGDLLSQDLREVIYHLGLITGDITTDDILGSIFSKFCIGK